MRDILPINRAMQENKIAQDVLGTIFSRGVATLVCPLFDHAYPQRRLSRFNVIARFRAVEDGVDADVLWTHRTRPQDLENCTNRQFSTASTPIFFSYRRKKTTKNAASVPI